MKQVVLLIIFYNLALNLFSQNQNLSFLSIGDKLNYLTKVGVDTLIFIHENSQDTILTQSPASFNPTDTITVAKVAINEITIFNQVPVFYKVKFLKLNSFEKSTEDIPKGKVVYETSLDINGAYHIYRLKENNTELTIEICRLINELGQVKISCKASDVPIVGDYDCKVHFRSIFFSTIEALYYQSSDWGNVEKYLRSPSGIDDISNLCYRGKDELRENRVNNEIEGIKDDFANKLENLQREDAGIMTMKESVFVSYCKVDPKAFKNDKKCNNLKKEIIKLDSEFLAEGIQDNIEKQEQYQKKRKKLNRLKDKFESLCKVDCFISKYSDTKLEFKPKNVWFKTDFYRVSDIRINGEIIKNGKKFPISLINKSFGFGIDGLIGGDNKTYTIVKYNVEIDGELFDIKFHVGEILDYKPRKAVWSKFFANSEYLIPSPDSIAIIKKRSINDFVSATIFTDVFGFIDDKPNSILQTEVSAYVPLNKWNKRRLNWFPELTGTLNFSLVNGFGENGKFVKPNFISNILSVDTSIIIMPPDTMTIFDTTNVDIGLLNAVEFLRNIDIDFNLRVKFLSLEIKGWSSFFNIEGGYRLFRAKVDVDVDPVEIDIKSKFIHSPEINLSLDIRPDWILGANIQLGGHYFTTFQTGKPDVVEFEINDENGDKEKNRFILRNEFNVYAFISSKRKSGIFFRYRGYHGFAKFGVRKKRQYFPSVLIGYSTNLAALIKGRRQ